MFTEMKKISIYNTHRVDVWQRYESTLVRRRIVNAIRRVGPDLSTQHYVARPVAPEIDRKSV